ncbi:MAG TPA: hypothetical protein VG055_09170 [Planctomycetaceae bacterium]|jgi:hypothetical protein|nr:hypothetical protein [Planctomycetaceae bacterium]
MKAIQIEAFGNPADVVKVVDVPDVGAPEPGNCRAVPGSSRMPPIQASGERPSRSRNRRD